MTTISVFEVETDGKFSRRYFTADDAATFCRGYGAGAAFREVLYQLVPGSAGSLQQRDAGLDLFADEKTPAAKLIDELQERCQAETDAIRDAVDDLIDLEIMAPNPWNYDDSGNHVTLPDDNARQFRLDIRPEYLIDVTGDVREQVADALVNISRDLLNASAVVWSMGDSLQAATVAETEDDAE